MPRNELLSGDLTYSYPAIWRVEENELTLSIVPAGLSKTMAIVVTTVMCLVWLVFALTLSNIWGFQTGIILSALLIPLFGLLCGIGFYVYHREVPKGPWIIVEKAAQKVLLPRIQVTIRFCDIVNLIVEIGRSTLPAADGSNIAELHLLANVNGELKRFPLIGALHPREFDEFLDRFVLAAGIEAAKSPPA
jgi:hypothetical protein